jgi:hypothetical protein
MLTPDKRKQEYTDLKQRAVDRKEEGTFPLFELC